MALKRFDQSDIIRNTIEFNPKVTFDVYSGSVYYQNEKEMSGSLVSNVLCVPTGYVSLYELNVDREESNTGFIHAVMVKSGDDDAIFKTIDINAYTEAEYGTEFTASYPMSSSITREWVSSAIPGYIVHEITNSLGEVVPITTGSQTAEWYKKARLRALRNSLNYNIKLSPSYIFSSSATRDLGITDVNIIYIPSIFYGSEIKKGTVDLRYYSSGSLIGRLTDSRYNGELVQSSGTLSSNDGSIAGVCLYGQGAILLTGSWNVSGATTWLDFAQGANDGENAGDYIVSKVDFEGTTYTQTITMLAHADKGEFNHSINPTFTDYAYKFKQPETSSLFYFEPEKLIKNTTFSPYPDPTGSFKKITYISKIDIYDETKNLIGIATVATPVKKTEERDFTFKLKIDI